jgi:predicted O-linked N-acetylglucosamine transferase (SPINDLY family)
MADSRSQIDAALAHLRAGRAAQARAIVQRLKPDEEVSTVTAMICAAQGQGEQARYHAGRAAAATKRADLLAELAGVMRVCGDLPAFFEYVSRALEIDENQGMAVTSLIQLAKTGENATAVSAAWVEAIGKRPLARLVIPFTTLLLMLGRADEAVRVAREALEKRAASGAAPTQADCVLASALANATNYLEVPDPEMSLREHRRYAAIAARAIPGPKGGASVASGAERVAGRPLRLGVISGDLRTHSVAFFAAALFEHLDPRSVELHVTSTHAGGDEVTARFRARAKTWREAHALSDADLAAKLREDKLDAILELSGHTSDHALGAMVHKPAPVILSYCGYPNTTGLESVDYRIVDSLTDPAGTEARCTEKLLRLDPCFLCYEPPSEAPGVTAAPEGAPVFGSFNNFAKMNPRVLRLWARVLARVPGSRLLLKAGMLSDEATRERVRAVFEGAGVARERVELVPRTVGFAEHMALYARVHVGLDTFPYAGTTTTCEAMWMGVPVVTLAGPGAGEAAAVWPHAARVGVSLLSAVGLGELAVADEEAYVGAAAALVSDRARLGEMRAGLRGRMRGSVLCDGPRFAKRFEGVLRSVVIPSPEQGGGRGAGRS